MPASTRIVSFRELLANHFDAPTLTEATGFAHSYGTNPYAGYDGESRALLLFRHSGKRALLHLPALLPRTGAADGWRCSCPRWPALALRTSPPEGRTSRFSGRRKLPRRWAPNPSGTLPTEVQRRSTKGGLRKQARQSPLELPARRAVGHVHRQANEHDVQRLGKATAG